MRSLPRRLLSLPLALSCLPAPVTCQRHAPAVTDLAVHGTDGKARVELTVAWPNAWRNARNHDAAWIVLRGPDARRGPLRLAAEGHGAQGKVAGAVQVGEDRLGVFVQPAVPHRGDVRFQVALVLDEPAPATVTAWAVGMVFIPGGAFELGDDDPTARRLGAFFRAGKDGAAEGPLEVESEAEIPVGKTAGALWYERDKNGYQGDQKGPIPAAWPKGTRPFWVMKHELTQGAYAAFLNTLPPQWQEQRAPLELKGEEIETCSIVREGKRFVAKAPDRPCSFVTWDDTCALFDWLALRPMTEFEFEKAARGPSRPVPGDYPWGTATDADLKRRVEKSRDLAHASVADESKLTDDTRARLGASWYWVMDLAGSVWERVVSAGDPAGRAFRGSHGDGVLSATGTATNEDWPRTDKGGAMAPGVGFRGGAEYFAPQPKDNPTNPHSPVAVRTYAGWGGAERYKTYSARGVRSAGR
jgi:formylglycine-generating enzyme required for sulfatase activity